MGSNDLHMYVVSQCKYTYDSEIFCKKIINYALIFIAIDYSIGAIYFFIFFKGFLAGP